MDAFGQNFNLDLSPAPSLLSNDFIFLSRDKNEIKLQNPQVEQCSYVIENVGKFRGNVDLCHGIQGMWMDKTSTYVIKPFSNASQEITSQHLLIKYKPKRIKKSLKWRIFNSKKAQCLKITKKYLIFRIWILALKKIKYFKL